MTDAYRPPTDAERARLQQATNDLMALLEHPGWKILMRRLEAEHDNALEDLAEAEITPETLRETHLIQNRVQRYRWFRNTVVELIQQGLTEEELADAVDVHHAEEADDYDPEFDMTE